MANSFERRKGQAEYAKEAKQKEDDSKLQKVSEEVRTQFERLQDPSLSKEAFFAMIEKSDDSLAETKEIPDSGSYQTVTRSISDHRTLTLKIWDNGAVSFSGSDTSGDFNTLRRADDQALH